MKNLEVNLLDVVDNYAKLDTGFRIIVDYLPSYDRILTRIDVKIAHKQYCIGLVSRYPIAPKAGQRISPDDDLITPSKAVEACLNLKVNKDQLIKALKELVQDLENDDGVL